MTANLLNMMMAGTNANGAGLSFSGFGASAQGSAASSSIGASFGGVNAAIGAPASVNFSSTLLQQLVNPQGEGVSQAQLDGFRAELPADMRGQLDALLNQLAIQDEGLVVSNQPNDKVQDQVAQTNTATASATAALSQVDESSLLALLDDAIHAHINAPSAGDKEQTLLDRLLARTSAEGDEGRPVSLMRTVDTEALPTDNAQSLWMNGLSDAVAQENVEQAVYLEAALRNAQPVAQAVATNMVAVQEVAQPVRSQMHQPSGVAISQQSASDVTAAHSQLDVAGVSRQVAGAQTSVNIINGFEELNLAKGGMPTEALIQAASQSDVKPSITSSFESLTFVNEMGVEHMQRPVQSDNISHFSAEFTRTPTFQSPADQVAMQIRQQTHLGMQQIQIQLEPADLGRVDVQLEIASDGKVSAMVSADNQDTLDLLQRDSKALQDALAQAGLEANAEDMQFSLNQQHNGDEYGSSEKENHMASHLHSEENDMATSEDVIANYQVNLQQGLDIRV